MASLSTCHLELVVRDGNLVKSLVKSRRRITGWQHCNGPTITFTGVKDKNVRSCSQIKYDFMLKNGWMLESLATSRQTICGWMCAGEEPLWWPKRNDMGRHWHEPACGTRHLSNPYPRSKKLRHGAMVYRPSAHTPKSSYFCRHGNTMLQQNNAHPHTAMVTQYFLQHHNIRTMLWLSLCIKQNRIEHFWDAL